LSSPKLFTMRAFSSLSAAAALLSTAAAQFVPAPTDLIEKMGFAGIPVRYKEVPTGICELDPDVKSYSGYADVAEHEHIFFWFFEARNIDPSEAPLTVWINGGPGSSSMIGLFQENGPCGVDIDGNVYNNPYSWSNVSNMLFIDEPAQVGFSYSIPVPGYTDPNSQAIVQLPDTVCPDYAEDWACGTYSYFNISLTPDSTPHGAPQFWKTLQGFMGAFPQYSRKGFHFTSESYGGHYGPVYNEYIEQQNIAIANGSLDAHPIKLESVLIGNGWFDPLLQYIAYYNFTVSPGNTYGITVNDSVAAEFYNNMWGPGNCVDLLNDCYARGIDAVCAYADNFCYAQTEYLYDIYLGRDEYDARELTPDPFPYAFYIDYLNTDAVMSAIGAYQNYSESSPTVGSAFAATGDDARRVSTVEDVAALLKQGVTVMLYAGDADYICNWLGVEAVADQLSPPYYESAGFRDIVTSDGIAHGQVKQAEKFSFVRIYESGHEVPFYQPLASLEIFDRAINGKDIATGTVKPGVGYATAGTKKSTFINGNTTVQNDIVPTNATYNTTTNAPDPPKLAKRAQLSKFMEKRSVQRPTHYGKKIRPMM
jgi:carboxypeptidase C (cathepsin A)